MRTPRANILVALGAVVFSLPAFAHGQSIPSPYTYLEERQEIGLSGGVLASPRGRFGFGPDGGDVLGIRYGIELSGPLSLEGVAQWISGDRNVIDPGRVEGDRVVGRATQEILTIEARLKFSLVGRRAWHRLSPYLSFGGGIAIDQSNPSEADGILLPEDRFDFGNSFYGTISGGSRFYLTDRFTIRAEGSFSLWKIDTPPGYADPARGFEGVADGEWLGGTGLSLGLFWRW